MPIFKRVKTKYPGVYYIKGISSVTGKPEKIYYIRYRRAGKMIEEKAGRQYQDDMTPARAAQKRARKIQGDELSNEEVRAEIAAQEKANEGKWTLNKLLEEYKAQRPDLKGIYSDNNRYELHLKSLFGEKEPKEIIQLDVATVQLSEHDITRHHLGDAGGLNMHIRIALNQYIAAIEINQDVTVGTQCRCRRCRQTLRWRRCWCGWTLCHRSER